jgi:tRNA(Arg) A34 adenosine deaminase TadA
MPTPEEFLRRAIALSRAKLADGERPFGAVVVHDGVVIGEGSAQQQASHDPTAHAEVVAIRAAAQALRSVDLRACELYTSCEPCPMCTALIYNTGIRAVYYGNVRADFAALGRDMGGVVEAVRLPVEERPGHARLLPEEARQVLTDWQSMPQFAAAMRRRT